MLHSVDGQPDAEYVDAQFDRLMDYIDTNVPSPFNHLEDDQPDILAFSGFPRCCGSGSGQSI